MINRVLVNFDPRDSLIVNIYCFVDEFLICEFSRLKVGSSFVRQLDDSDEFVFQVSSSFGHIYLPITQPVAAYISSTIYPSSKKKP